MLLENIESKDRKFCLVDYENAINYVKRQKKNLIDDLWKEVVAITTDFFNKVISFSSSAYDSLICSILLTEFMFL